ncbi:hypothetical protein CSHISOI_10089 [Colletotrichum shisoi]|uniref:Uncharacterized protein n=1 Tax=Colletotrichum shisoi TaxID=2078593 RepID=A0A5Q4BEG1_9PEZI|nr:hypothetical protein CSHISOI_10089 [Colletotrichum shisoi]
MAFTINRPNSEFQFNFVREHSHFRDLDRLLDSGGNDFLYARKPPGKACDNKLGAPSCMPACRHLLPCCRRVPWFVRRTQCLVERGL